MADHKSCKHYNSCNFRNDTGSCPNSCIQYKHKDIEQVVRCKDCKQWGGVVYGGRCKHWSSPLAGVTHFTCADDFCSYGERKNNEDNT